MSNITPTSIPAGMPQAPPFVMPNFMYPYPYYPYAYPVPHHVPPMQPGMPLQQVAATSTAAPQVSSSPSPPQHATPSSSVSSSTSSTSSPSSLALSEASIAHESPISSKKSALSISNDSTPMKTRKRTSSASVNAHAGNASESVESVASIKPKRSAPSKPEASTELTPSNGNDALFDDSQSTTEDEKMKQRRVVHSEVERRRRDRINVRFEALKHIVPTCKSGDLLSKVVILEKAIFFVQAVVRENESLRKDLQITRVQGQTMKKLLKQHNIEFKDALEDAVQNLTGEEQSSILLDTSSLNFFSEQGNSSFSDSEGDK